MELHVDYLINVLPIVGTGMLGVFLVKIGRAHV